MLSVPDVNVLVGRECTPLRAEFVMRSYLTGVTSTSIWRAYERGDRVFCGHDLPQGMTKNQKLPKAILTPSTKAQAAQLVILLAPSSNMTSILLQQALYQ